MSEFQAQKIYNKLLEVESDTGIPTGNIKDNLPSDPDYIGPSEDNNVCPVYFTEWVPDEDTAYCEQTATPPPPQPPTPDFTPDQFVFNDLVNQEVSNVLLSNVIQINGINQPIACFIESDSQFAFYSKNGGPWKNDGDTLLNGDLIQLKVNSSNNYNTPISVKFVANNVEDTWIVTTKDIVLSCSLPQNFSANRGSSLLMPKYENYSFRNTTPNDFLINSGGWFWDIRLTLNFKNSACFLSEYSGLMNKLFNSNRSLVVSFGNLPIQNRPSSNVFFNLDIIAGGDDPENQIEMQPVLEIYASTGLVRIIFYGSESLEPYSNSTELTGSIPAQNNEIQLYSKNIGSQIQTPILISFDEGGIFQIGAYGGTSTNESGNFAKEIVKESPRTIYITPETEITAYIQRICSNPPDYSDSSPILTLAI